MTQLVTAMKYRASSCFLTLALLTGCCSPQPPDHGIPNFAVVDPAKRVYRGTQPTTPEAWKHIRDLGVQTVVKLNGEGEGSDAGAEAEGLTVVRLPISTVQQTIGSPKVSTVDSAVAQLRLGKCYVHCGSTARSSPNSLAAKLGSQGGQDRTGLIVAIYRVRIDHRTKCAEKEMMEHCFHPMLPGLANFWRDEVK
jgi:hypothetical protein